MFPYVTDGNNYFKKNIMLFACGCLLILSFVVVIILVTIHYRRKTQHKQKKKKHFLNDVEGSVASRDPLIPGQSLKDLLDHTTSGSGIASY